MIRYTANAALLLSVAACLAALPVALHGVSCQDARLPAA